MESMGYIDEAREGGFSERRVSVESGKFEPSNCVLDRIVESFNSRTVLRKTVLQLDSKLRWDIMIKYLDWLQNGGYVVKSDDEYRLTSLGIELFGRFQEFRSFIHR